MKKNSLHSYAFTLVLLLSLMVGSVAGILLKKKAVILKPFGDIFLNLLFTVVVPLVFFSISSAVASAVNTHRLMKIMGVMLAVFVLTGIISSLLMVAGVVIFNPAGEISVPLSFSPPENKLSLAEQLVSAFTVSDFGSLLSRKNMLALIVFSMLVGIAASMIGEKAKVFTQFLVGGAHVMMKVVQIIMLYAPIGLAAYFAYLIGTLGPQLLGSYVKAMILYYPLSIGYFLIGFTGYAYFAGGKKGVAVFWKNILPTALTAFATGSSVASIPSNLEAAKKIGVPEDIREVVIPIGSTIHMDGSCLSAILKISVLFGIFQMDFNSWPVIFSAVGIALLSGIVMSGIPGGGFLGEMVIVTLYGFPPEALVIISMIGTLVDPPATMVNSVGDNVASMMVARIMNGKKWMEKSEANTD
jgi:Na+/H+-dicarboxylate symporter